MPSGRVVDVVVDEADRVEPELGVALEALARAAGRPSPEPRISVRWRSAGERCSADARGGAAEAGAGAGDPTRPTSAPATGCGASSSDQQRRRAATRAARQVEPSRGASPTPLAQVRRSSPA